MERAGEQWKLNGGNHRDHLHVKRKGEKGRNQNFLFWVCKMFLLRKGREGKNIFEEKKERWKKTDNLVFYLPERKNKSLAVAAAADKNNTCLQFQFLLSSQYKSLILSTGEWGNEGSHSLWNKPFAMEEWEKNIPYVYKLVLSPSRALTFLWA